MGRAKTQQKRAKRGATASAQRQPTALGPGNEGRGVTKRTGVEREAPLTYNPIDIADPQARVIKSRS